MSMPVINFVYAQLLFFLGLYGYFGTGTNSITALIPAFFGIVLTILAALSLQPKFRMHAMHGSVVIAILGIFGSIKGLSKLPALLAGEEVTRPNAVIAQSIMAILSIIYVLICVNSFIQARRERKLTN